MPFDRKNILSVCYLKVTLWNYTFLNYRASKRYQLIDWCTKQLIAHWQTHRGHISDVFIAFLCLCVCFLQFVQPLAITFNKRYIQIHSRNLKSISREFITWPGLNCAESRQYDADDVCERGAMSLASGVSWWSKKDEFHWLATGRASGKRNSAPITPHEMYFPSTYLPSPPSFSCLRRTWWDGVNEDVWRVSGELANPGWPGRMAAK